MKKLFIVALMLVFSIVLFQSCNEPITEESTSDELSLKSANGVKSYIKIIDHNGRTRQIQ